MLFGLEARLGRDGAASTPCLVWQRSYARISGECFLALGYWFDGIRKVSLRVLFTFQLLDLS